MSGLLSLGIFRAASGIAHDAIESVSHTATSLAKTVSGPAVASPTFAETLNVAPPDAESTVPETRVKLTAAIEAVLDRIGVPKDPALTFVANDDGTLQLEGDHEFAAAIDSNLSADAEVQALTNQLIGSSTNGADRRIVLHAITAS